MRDVGVLLLLLLIEVEVEIVARGVMEVDRCGVDLGCCIRVNPVNTRCRTVGVPSPGGSSEKDSAMVITRSVAPRVTFAES